MLKFTTCVQTKLTEKSEDSIDQLLSTAEKSIYIWKTDAATRS